MTKKLKKMTSENAEDLYLLAKSSLLTRILFYFSTFALIVWLITGLFTFFESKEYSDTFFDTQQILFAKKLAVMDFEPRVYSPPKTKAMLGTSKKGGKEDDDALSFVIFSLDGQIIFTDGEESEHFPFPRNNQLGFKNIELDDDEEWRIFYLENIDNTRIIAVGQEIDYRQDMIVDILKGQLLPWIFSLPLLLIGLTWLVYKEIMPLRKIAKNLNYRKSDDISPIQIEPIALEIRPLVKALNDLFLRTGVLLEKERHFVANAAHELRTPLAGLAIQAEVISMCYDDKEALTHASNKLLEGINRSTRLIDQLLLLSSIENKYTKNEEELTGQVRSWQEIIQETFAQVTDIAIEKNIEISFNLTENKIEAHQAELWAIALRNLADNALRYSNVDAENKSEIKVSLTDKGLIIENSCAHLPKEVLEKLGERFYRPAGQNTRGTGLGLAIVGHICQLQNFKFIIDNASIGEKKEYLSSLPLSLDGVLTAIIFE